MLLLSQREMRTIKITGLILSAAWVGTVPARAAIVDVTYTGIITQGADQTGVFGIVDTNGGAYVGYNYTANYVFNTSIGITASTPTENLVYGGTYYNTPSPLLSASVTVNGVTATILTNGPQYLNNDDIDAGILPQYRLGPGSTQQASAEYVYLNYDPKTNTGIYTNNQLTNLITNPTEQIPISITGNFTYKVGPNDMTDGYFQLVTEDLGVGITTDTYFTADLTSVTLTNVTPLPSTWLMLLSGFAGLGFFAYRRTKKNAPVIAAA